MLSPTIIKQYLKNLPPGTIDIYVKTAKDYFYAQMPETDRVKAVALTTQLMAMTSGLSADTIMWVACVVGENIARALSAE